jgi:hypothetical protein
MAHSQGIRDWARTLPQHQGAPHEPEVYRLQGELFLQLSQPHIPQVVAKVLLEAL